MTQEIFGSKFPDLCLSSQMRCGLLASAKGDIMIIHDKPLPSGLEWVEYNKADNTLNLIDENGAMVNLGVPIDPEMSKNLTQGLEVFLTQIENSMIVASQKVSIVIQDY